MKKTVFSGFVVVCALSMVAPEVSAWGFHRSASPVEQEVSQSRTGMQRETSKTLSETSSDASYEDIDLSDTHLWDEEATDSTDDMNADKKDKKHKKDKKGKKDKKDKKHKKDKKGKHQEQELDEFGSEDPLSSESSYEESSFSGLEGASSDLDQSFLEQESGDVLSEESADEDQGKKDKKHKKDKKDKKGKKDKKDKKKKK